MDVHRRLPHRWPLKFITIRREARHKPAIAQEELPVFHAHKTIKAIFPAGRVMAELGRGLLDPGPAVRANPLVAKESLALQVTVLAPEVL